MPTTYTPRRSTKSDRHSTHGGEPICHECFTSAGYSTEEFEALTDCAEGDCWSCVQMIAEGEIEASEQAAADGIAHCFDWQEAEDLGIASADLPELESITQTATARRLNVVLPLGDVTAWAPALEALGADDLADRVRATATYRNS